MSRASQPSLHATLNEIAQQLEKIHPTNSARYLSQGCVSEFLAKLWCDRVRQIVRETP
jgi:hypothetical protein